MEVDQSRRDSPRTRSLLGGAGMAGPSAAQSSSVAMKTPAIPLSLAFEVASAVALAQGASDPVADLRACSLMEQTERLECLEKLSRSIAPPARPAPAGDDRVARGTTSPRGHTPILAAKAASHGALRGSLHRRPAQRPRLCEADHG